MIKPKLKRCQGPCDQDKVIWKNYQGKRLCQECWNKMKPTIKPTGRQSHIAKVSVKKSKEDKIYTGKRLIYLTENPMCQIHIPGGLCTRVATDIHHTYSGKDRSKYYLDITTWLSACRYCHDWVHDHPSTSRELGLLK